MVLMSHHVAGLRSDYAGLELTFLQRGLEKYNTAVVLILFQACLTICAFMGDYIMFGDFYEYVALRRHSSRSDLS